MAVFPIVRVRFSPKAAAAAGCITVCGFSINTFKTRLFTATFPDKINENIFCALINAGYEGFDGGVAVGEGRTREKITTGNAIVGYAAAAASKVKNSGNKTR